MTSNKEIKEKRDWEQRSSAYYAGVQRYLVKTKHSKKHSAGSDTDHNDDESQKVDAKFAARKAAFEADRMAYACYLLELHDVLRKQLSIYYEIFSEFVYAKQIKEDNNFEEVKTKVAVIKEDLVSSTTQREEQLRKYQTKRDECIRKWQMQLLGQREAQESSSTEQTASEQTTQQVDNEHREGLYASTKSTLSKTQWHRYWCTLSTGFLYEYHFDLHQGEENREPSLRLHQSHSLALCTVRASGGQNAGNAAIYPTKVVDVSVLS